MLPDEDKDRQLAARIGQRLHEGRSGRDLGDEPLLQHLSAYRAQAEMEDGPGMAASARMWRQIEAQRHPQPFLFRLAHAFVRPRWAAPALAAALALIVAFWWFTGTSTQEILLAEAHAATVVYQARDGSTITLRPHSRLYHNPSDTQSSRFRLEGEGYFEVTRDESRTFTVQAGDGQVSVLGTAFNLSSWGGVTTVYLAEGRVQFEDMRTGESVVMEPGQGSRLSATGGIAPPTPGQADEALDWMAGAMSFSQQPLVQVAAELGHHFGLTLTLPPHLEQDTVSGRILLEAPEQSLADLEAILGGRFEETSPGMYRFVE